MPDSFKDQFAPFLHFGNDFKEQYKGTLFRFPLRTTSLARRSEISKKSYTISDIQKNLDDLVAQLSSHLIFLRSVKTIEIYSCKIGSKAVLIHKATSSISEREGQNDQSLLHYFDKKSNSPREAFYEKLLSTPERRLPTQSFKLRVVVDSTIAIANVSGSSSGSDRGGDRAGDGVKIRSDREGLIGGIENQMSIVERTADKTSEETTTSILNTDTTNVTNEITPNTPSTISSQETVEYLVMTGLMGGEARRIACEESSRHLKLVPLGAVAACISRRGPGQNPVPGSSPGPGLNSGPGPGPDSGAVNGSRSGPCFPPILGQAFCFLPLPVRTQLPVHANAYWELSANRRDIWR